MSFDKNMEPKDFYTIAEIAAQLRVQVSAVRSRLTQKDPTLPPSIRIGGRRLFPAAAYEIWKQDLLEPIATPAAEHAVPGQSVVGSEPRGLE